MISHIPPLVLFDHPRSSSHEVVRFPQGRPSAMYLVANESSWACEVFTDLAPMILREVVAQNQARRDDSESDLRTCFEARNLVHMRRIPMPEFYALCVLGAFHPRTRKPSNHPSRRRGRSRRRVGAMDSTNPSRHRRRSRRFSGASATGKGQGKSIWRAWPIATARPSVRAGARLAQGHEQYQCQKQGPGQEQG